MVSCLPTNSPKFASSDDRVTKIPAAIDIIIAGIWLTNPSPMDSIVYFSSEAVIVISFWKYPISIPPIILTTVMKIPAIASPLTNLLAPSIEP